MQLEAGLPSTSVCKTTVTPRYTAPRGNQSFSLSHFCVFLDFFLLAAVSVALPSSAFSFVLFPGVVRARRDDPADPPTRWYLCCSAASPRSLSQPEPFAAWLLPSLLAHLWSMTTSPCLLSTVDGRQWSCVGHLPRSPLVPCAEVGAAHGFQCPRKGTVLQGGRTGAEQ